MKRYLVTTALALALGLGSASAQNITRSIQGNANDPRGPIGWDTSNSMYFPNHINAFGNTSALPSVTTAGCGAGAAITTNSTDTAGSVTLGGSSGSGATSCTVAFGSTFNAAPNCLVGETTVDGTTGTSGFTIKTATTSFTVSRLTSGTTMTWICIGNQ